MIPELRTSRRLALALAGGALAAIPVAVFGVTKLERAFESEAGATVVLGLWCLLGAAAAIIAIVDAYIKPEGERLELAAKVIATVFAVLALVVVAGILVGATGALSDESAALSDQARAEQGSQPH